MHQTFPIQSRLGGFYFFYNTIVDYSKLKIIYLLVVYINFNDAIKVLKNHV